MPNFVQNARCTVTIAFVFDKAHKTPSAEKSSFRFCSALYCIIHIYPPFTRKRIVSLYFGRDVRTR